MATEYYSIIPMQTFSLSDPLSIIVIILAVVVVILIGVIFWMNAKLRRFLVGMDSNTIGDSLAHMSRSLDDLHAFRDRIDEYLAQVERRLKKSVQSVHTVRFNPFKGTGGGGNQSFSTAFLNEEGDGVIISSLYSREHVSVYSKPVKRHASEFELSDEERESLDNAIKALK
jgi:hypothetical protein